MKWGSHCCIMLDQGNNAALGCRVFFPLEANGSRGKGIPYRRRTVMDQWRLSFFVVLLTCLLLVCPAQAGQFCSDASPTPEAVQKGLQLALKTQHVLQESGAQVALIGRIGADLSQYGLRYSHAGFVWHAQADGRWLVE